MPGIGPHPRGLHLWWARRPLAAARAVIFAQMVDDPSAYVDLLRADPKLHRKASPSVDTSKPAIDRNRKPGHLTDGSRDRWRFT